MTTFSARKIRIQLYTEVISLLFRKQFFFSMPWFLFEIGKYQFIQFKIRLKFFLSLFIIALDRRFFLKYEFQSNKNMSFNSKQISSADDRNIRADAASTSYYLLLWHLHNFISIFFFYFCLNLHTLLLVRFNHSYD